MKIRISTASASIESMIKDTFGIAQSAPNVQHPNYTKLYVAKHMGFNLLDKFLLMAKAAGWKLESRCVYKSPSGVNFSVDLRYSDPKSVDYKQALVLTEAKIILVG